MNKTMKALITLQEQIKWLKTHDRYAEGSLSPSPQDMIQFYQSVDLAMVDLKIGLKDYDPRDNETEAQMIKALFDLRSMIRPLAESTVESLRSDWRESLTEVNLRRYDEITELLFQWSNPHLFPRKNLQAKTWKIREDVPAPSAHAIGKVFIITGENLDQVKAINVYRAYTQNHAAVQMWEVTDDSE